MGIFGAVEIDPLDSNVIYYVAHEKFYKSTNGGKSWILWSTISEETDWANSITIDSKNPNIIFVCRHSLGLFKSNDGGKTWKNITTGKIRDSINRINIDPNNSNILYLLTWGGGVYKSTDGGENWFQINKNMYSCCTYNLVINSNNTNELILSTHLSGIYYSNNGGSSWKLLTTNLLTNDCAWVDALFEPKLTIFTGTYGGGVYKLVFKPTPPLITKIEEDYNGIRLTWDKSKEGSNPIIGYEIFRSEGVGKYESIGKVESDLTFFIDKNITFGKIYYYYIKAYDNEIPTVYSESSNVVSIKTTEKNIVLKKFENNLDFKFINKIISTDKDTIFLGTETGLYKLVFKNNIPQIANIFLEKQSIDDFYIYQDKIILLTDGNIYSIINNELKEIITQNNLKVEKIFCNSDLSNIYYIDEEKKLYKIINLKDIVFINNLNYMNNIQFITVDPVDNNILYIGAEEGLYKSIDGGKNFSEKNIGLKNTFISSIAINPFKTNEIYLSTWGENIYFSNNGGESWEVFGKKDRELFTYKIYLHPQIPYLIYLATQQGLFLIDNYEDKNIYLSNIWIKDVILSDDKILFSYFGDGLYYYTKVKKVDLKEKINLKFEIKDENTIKLMWDKLNIGNIYEYLIYNSDVNSVDKFIPFDYASKNENFKEIKLNDLKSNYQYFSIKYFDDEIIPNISDFSNIIEVNKLILSDKTLPELIVSIPEKVKEPKLDISGKVNDRESGVLELKINNANVNFDRNGQFNYTLELNYGENLIKFEVVDKAGNKLVRTFTVKYQINIIKILLQIGNKIIYINDQTQEIDVPPQIIEGRTYLPIRYIAEPIGATVEWDGKDKKVTIRHKDKIIELWVGKNIAKVNGISTPIDPNNPKVVPLIISGRTMLPVRFVAESLGCQVDYNSKYKLVTIIYEFD